MLNVTPAEGPIGTSPIEVTPPPAEAGYPQPHTVPPRPQLSYSVEQRRAIVEGLISDRENARYTGELVRYRTGQTDLPPPPRPERPPTEDVAGLVAPPQPPLPEPTQQPPGLAQRDTIRAEEGYRRLSEADAELDDGSLGDFIRDMVRESGPPEDAQPFIVPVPATAGQSAGATPAAQSEAPASTAGQRRESAAGRFFGWLRGLFGAGEADAAAANGPGEAEPDESPGQAVEQDEPPAQASDAARVSAPAMAGDAPEPPIAVAALADAAAPRPGPARAKLEQVVEPSPPAPRTSTGALPPDEAPGQP